MDAEFILLQLVTPAASIVFLGPVVLYVLARWRANRDGVTDPHLGFKFAFHYFATIAFHVTLAGGALLVYTMIKPADDGESKGQLYRMAFGFIVPGGIVLAAHLVMLMRTNDGQITGVRRLFSGFNLVITGLVGFGALVLGFQALFAKGKTGGMGHLGGAAILIYGSAWGLLLWRHWGMMFGDGSGTGMQPMPEVVTPPVPPQAAAQGGSGGGHQGGGGLPPLGGGSFPPIDTPRR